MRPGPLLVFDFDGVLVDGMPEYWWAARSAAAVLAAREGETLPLPEAAPPAFALLRPLIHKGWEMVLMAAELARPDFDLTATLADYPRALAEALVRRCWSAELLQETLEAVRSEAIVTDPQTWLGRHRFYPGVVERLGRLAAEGAAWAVLTTKGGAFASRLLAAASLKPLCVFGHEQGSKTDVLLRLQDPGSSARPLWFLEDRRPTLEQVRATPGLEAVRCYLAAWGYLAPGDGEGLGALGIRWLEPDRFAAPLAQWP